MSRLNGVEHQVSKISVPRGYSRELYDMRIHIEMLRKKLVEAGQDISEIASATAQENSRKPS
jgi:hypothetical protein